MKTEITQEQLEFYKKQVEFYKNRGISTVFIENTRNKMTIKRIKVKETKKHYGDFEGKLEDIITALQRELDAGWEGLESEYEWEYGCDERYIEFYFYKHREETDKEYNKRVKQLEKQEAVKAKAKEQKLEQLKKELANLTEDELKQLGVK